MEAKSRDERDLRGGDAADGESRFRLDLEAICQELELPMLKGLDVELESPSSISSIESPRTWRRKHAPAVRIDATEAAAPRRVHRQPRTTPKKRRPRRGSRTRRRSKLRPSPSPDAEPTQSKATSPAALQPESTTDGSIIADAAANDAPSKVSSASLLVSAFDSQPRLDFHAQSDSVEGSDVGRLDAATVPLPETKVQPGQPIAVEGGAPPPQRDGDVESQVLRSDDGDAKDDDDDDDDGRTLEEFLKTLKYLKRSPKKKQYTGLWRKRWEREVRDSLSEKQVLLDRSRQKLVGRLRRIAQSRPLKNATFDYSRVYCLFDLMFSTSWSAASHPYTPALAFQMRQFNGLKAFLAGGMARQNPASARSAGGTSGPNSARSAKPHSARAAANRSLAYIDTGGLDLKSERLFGTDLEPSRLCYCVSSRRPEVQSILREAVRRLSGDSAGETAVRWDEIPYPDESGHIGHFWNLIWTWGRPSLDFSRLLVWQKVNYFPGSVHLTRKDLMKERLEELYTRQRGGPFRVIPDTFILPKQRAEFTAAFRRVKNQLDGESEAGSQNLWIVKPINLSRGRGIYVVDNPGGVPDDDTLVVSRYIANPLLHNGFKFDLRLYVLVTSFDPLEAFLYQRGFARLASARYNTRGDDIRNPFVHLTNSSVQKHNKQSELGALGGGAASRGGSKITLAECIGQLRASGIDTDKLMQNITSLILASLVAVRGSVESHVNSFELYGYDVLVDSALKPWLIEVNSGPSLAVENQVDRKIKPDLVTDVLRLVNPIPFDRDALRTLFMRRMRTRNWAERVPRSTAELRAQINTEFSRILHGRAPRLAGESPARLGGFVRIAPSAKAKELDAARQRATGDLSAATVSKSVVHQ